MVVAGLKFNEAMFPKMWLPAPKMFKVVVPINSKLMPVATVHEDSPLR